MPLVRGPKLFPICNNFLVEYKMLIRLIWCGMLSNTPMVMFHKFNELVTSLAEKFPPKNKHCH